MRVFRRPVLELERAGEVEQGPDGWWDCTAGFLCLCGRGFIHVDDQEPRSCEGCGRSFRLHAFVTVEEP